MNIGDKIKQLRQSLDLTQDELAQKVGYKSRSSINKIELGERDVSRPMIIKFAEALNTTPAYLMGWEDEQENNEDTASIIKIGKRIESARTDLKLTQEELAKKLGLNKSTIQRYEAGKVMKIKIPVIDAMAKALNVNPAWLTDKSDNKEPYSSDDRSDRIEANAEVLPHNAIRMIPVFETVSAGFGAYASGEIVDYMPLFIENDYEAAETLCIKVRGDSMYPKIEDGDIIQVHKQSVVDNGQIAVVLVDGDEGLVKKFYCGKDYIKLISINPEYPPKVFEREEMNRLEIVGLVRKIIKEC